MDIQKKYVKSYTTCFTQVMDWYPERLLQTTVYEFTYFNGFFYTFQVHIWISLRKQTQYSKIDLPSCKASMVDCRSWRSFSRLDIFFLWGQYSKGNKKKKSIIQKYQTKRSVRNRYVVYLKCEALSHRKLREGGIS